MNVRSDADGMKKQARDAEEGSACLFSADEDVTSL